MAEGPRGYWANVWDGMGLGALWRCLVPRYLSLLRANRANLQLRIENSRLTLEIRQLKADVEQLLEAANFESELATQMMAERDEWRDRFGQEQSAGADSDATIRALTKQNDELKAEVERLRGLIVKAMGAWESMDNLPDDGGEK